ncbi:hypothetical protein LMG1231_03573 [Achromobacter denitrificans]|nr:hypothetical protein LMG1231_03573 [Achromobacter denitrificans]
MMPAHHVLAIGRAAAAGVGTREAPAQDPDHGARQRQHHAGHRQPHHDVVPPAIQRIAAKRIQPVDPGARVVPAALQARGVQHHHARGGRDVEPRARGVVQVHAVQRPVGAERARMGEDVLVHLALIARAILSAGPGLGGRQRGRGIGGGQEGAARGVHHPGRPPRLAGHQIDRRAAAGGDQAQSGGVFRARRGQRLRRRHRDGRRVQRRQVRQPFLGRELGIAHVHHHHAGDEPHGEEQAQHDARPAVDQVQPPLGARRQRRSGGTPGRGSKGRVHGGLSWRTDQKRACKVSSTERGAPR